MRLTDIAHNYLREVLIPASVAVDATCGNGHDTIFMARLVGPSGKVFGFDIQEEGLRKTKERLAGEGLGGNTILLLRSHSDLSRVMSEASISGISAFTFNLGYLPGSDRSIITLPETTVAAVQSACRLLIPKGRGTVLIYRGHDGGETEAEALRQMIDFEDLKCSLTEVVGNPNPTAPLLWLIERSSS